MDLKSPEQAELSLDPEAEPRGTPIGRRVVLGLLAAGAVGVVAGARIQNWLEDVVAPVVSKDGTGLSSLLPIGRFRIYTVTGDLPGLSKSDYTLKVRGLVDTPANFSYADLRAMEPTNLTRDFQCVTGWRVSDVKWRGVKLRDVLDRVGVAEKARAVRFYSFDGAYSESLTLEQARRNDVILAYEMEGNDLSTAHGGPVRLYVAPMYGYKSIKWLGGIEVVKKVVPGYWEQRGYDVDAWVGRSNGRDDEST
jgi:DMSO/TMAO reductase YedYZ molybdopterin-dependent catalytic subunit